MGDADPANISWHLLCWTTRFMEGILVQQGIAAPTTGGIQPCGTILGVNNGDNVLPQN